MYENRIFKRDACNEFNRLTRATAEYKYVNKYTYKTNENQIDKKEKTKSDVKF